MVATFGAAGLVGLLLAHDVKLGVALLMALCYVPLAFVSLPLALLGWLVLSFLSRLPHMNGPANFALILLFFMWLGVLSRRRPDTAALVERRRLLLATGLLVLWLSLSLAWAGKPHFAKHDIEDFYFDAFVVAAMLTVLVRPAHARWLAGTFVAGAVLSVLAGLATGGLVTPSSAAASGQQGRLQGAAGDPNYLAALIVPALLLAAGLAVRRSPLQRLALLGAIGILAPALAATQSRGGLVAAGVSCLAAFVVFRGRRLLIGTLVVVVVAGTAVFFVMSPASWNRVAHNDSGDSGRSDIWTVAWKMARDHPIAGVGLSQFPLESPRYTRRVGSLTFVNEIVDEHIVVHNLYLQLLTETGILGLALFLGVVVTSLGAARRAVAQFDTLGESELATLTRAGVVALVGSLTASFFLSNANDRRLWVLLALGPMLLGVAERLAQKREASEPTLGEAAPVPPLARVAA